MKTKTMRLLHWGLAVIFLIHSTLPVVKGVLCYKCTIVAPPVHYNMTKRLCSDFDFSDNFIVDCPYSTFCLKKTYTVTLNSKLINGTSRDCAQQMNVIQEYVDNRWQRKILIENPYEDGCTETNDKGLRSSTTTHCYCEGDLCNSSISHKSLYYIVPVIVLFSIYNYFDFLS